MTLNRLPLLAALLLAATTTPACTGGFAGLFGATASKNPIIQSYTANPTQTTAKNQPITFQVAAFDADPLQFLWTATGGTLSTTTGQAVIWTPPAAAGTYTVLVTITNSRGGAANGSLNVIVTADGTANVAAPGTPPVPAASQAPSAAPSDAPPAPAQTPPPAAPTQAPGPMLPTIQVSFMPLPINILPSVAPPAFEPPPLPEVRLASIAVKPRHNGQPVRVATAFARSGKFVSPTADFGVDDKIMIRLVPVLADEDAVIQVLAPGFKAWGATIKLQADKVNEVEANLEAVIQAPPPPPFQPPKL